MKFTLKEKPLWNGKTELPDEINVVSYHPIISEFELLSVICALHGHLTAFDIMARSESESEKDKDIQSVMSAFRLYIFPKIPLSNYSNSRRNQSITETSKVVAIDSKKL
jgi:hypothetical protein